MRVRDPSLRDDIAQEAWLRIYRLREEFRGDCAVSSWLVAIVDQMVRTKLRDECRRVARDERMREPLEYPDQPDDMADRNRTVKRLRATLATMPAIKRATIILRAVDEAALTEVAAMTGLSVGAVKSSAFRGLRLVRKCLS
jgi:RNA polymerase sigma-70 factor (ECF subfamily)